ncbi:hypothetical protein FOZ60_006292 [Perkinsus olseni]|uniref:Ion transport domain-containing protein n=1 Tax=Perkinsus olseni TaxID=32597 RepID=A0A7J6NPQ8_PEROL|nr:hypothetical protein FOZ60_006292 [Perkinsus olseni]
MLIGEWPFDDFDGYENQGVMVFYMIVFGVVMFFMVLNFFLAIVVDSFESTKQEIEEYKVEGSLFSDVWHLMVQFAMRHTRQWPSRALYIERLSRFREDAARQTGAAVQDESGTVVQTSGTKRVSLEKFKTYFNSPAEREGVESMFLYYHSHFAQDTEDFLHPLFGRSQSVKIQMASAYKPGANMVREITKEKQEKGRLKADLAVALETIRHLEQENGQLRKRLDGGSAAAGGAGGAEDINEIVDPIERKLAVLDGVIKAINKQRALFASRVAGNLPLPKHTLEAISTGVTFGVPHPDQGLPPALPPSVTAKRRRQKALLKATRKGPRPMQQKKPVSLSPKRVMMTPHRAETILQRPRSTPPVGGSELASGLGRETAEVKRSVREPERRGEENIPEGLPDTTSRQFPGEADPEAPIELPQNDGGMDEEAPYRYHRQRRDGRHDYSPDRRLRAGEPNPMVKKLISLQMLLLRTPNRSIYRFQCTEFQLLSFVDRLANSINLDIIDHDAAHETISELFANMKEPVRGEASRSFARLRDLVVDAPWTRRKGKTFL